MAPTQDQINGFFEFTGGTATEDQAVRFLDNCGGDVQRAVMEFFDDPSKYDKPQPYAGWDPSAFNTDRDGNPDPTAQPGIPSFTIDAGDDMGTGGVSSTAPTRPPSRRSMYSNRSGGNGQQESGTINSHGQERSGGHVYFGPAEKGREYNPAQWAMVPVSSAARVYDNPDADERKRDRESGQPVFFKPMRERDALPSLVAVLAQIPGARKELLFDEQQAEHYGSNTKWWDGEGATEGEPRIAEDVIQQQEVILETQRLMAFAHGTNRAYGSVESIEKLPFMSNDIASQISSTGGINQTAELRFMLCWSKAAEMFGSNASHGLFRNVVHAGEKLADGSFDRADTDVYRLELDMSQSEPKQTIYNAIDRMVWMGDLNGDSDDEYYIDQVADVLVIRVKNRHTNDNASGLGLQVPPTFCPDRYLKSNMATMKHMRKEKGTLRQSIADLNEQQAKFNYISHPKDPQIQLDREDAFNQAIQHYRRRDKPKEVKKKPKTEGEEDTQMEEPLPKTKWDEVADELEKQHQKIKDRLKKLDERKAAIEKQMAELSNILTEHIDEAEPLSLRPNLNNQYFLRGVGIGPEYETTFVYVDPASAPPSPASPSESAMDLDADTYANVDASQCKSHGQWWRFEFPTSDKWGKPDYKVVSEEEVLAEASDSAKEALLIYGASAVCDVNDVENMPPVLWPGLQAFVDNDNITFENEVQEALTSRQQYAQQQGGEDGWPATEIQMMDGTSAYDNQQGPALPPRHNHGQNLELPPSYDDSIQGVGAQHLEHIPDLKVEEDEWVPDPGPSLVSDQEYAANMNAYPTGSGRGVSTMMGGQSTGFSRHSEPYQYNSGKEKEGKKTDDGFNHWFGQQDHESDAERADRELLEAVMKASISET